MRNFITGFLMLAFVVGGATVVPNYLEEAASTPSVEPMRPSPRGTAISLEGVGPVVTVMRAQWYSAASRPKPWAQRTSVDWDSIAGCETGGNWHMVGRTFSGGVGFANTTWNGFGGREFASNAGYASRQQQIIVAERVYAKYGLSGWGCKRYG